MIALLESKEEEGKPSKNLLILLCYKEKYPCLWNNLIQQTFKVKGNIEKIRTIYNLN